MVNDTRISAVTSSPPVTLISRLTSPDKPKHDKEAKVPRQQVDEPRWSW